MNNFVWTITESRIVVTLSPLGEMQAELATCQATGEFCGC